MQRFFTRTDVNGEVIQQAPQQRRGGENTLQSVRDTDPVGRIPRPPTAQPTAPAAMRPSND